MATSTEYVIVNGEALALMEDGRFPVYYHFPENTRLFDATCLPPRLIPLEEEGDERGVTLFRLIPHAPYFAYRVAGPSEVICARPTLMGEGGVPPVSVGGMGVTEHSRRMLGATPAGLSPSLLPAARPSATEEADSESAANNGAAASSSTATTAAPLPRSTHDDVYTAIPQTSVVLPASRCDATQQRIEALHRCATGRLVHRDDGSTSMVHWLHRTHQRPEVAAFRASLADTDPRGLHRYIVVHGLPAGTTPDMLEKRMLMMGAEAAVARGDYISDMGACLFRDPATEQTLCRSTAFVELKNLDDAFGVILSTYLQFGGGHVYVVGADRKPNAAVPAIEPLPTAVGPAPEREYVHYVSNNYHRNNNNNNNGMNMNNGGEGMPHHHTNNNNFDGGRQGGMGGGRFHNNGNGAFGDQQQQQRDGRDGRYDGPGGFESRPRRDMPNGDGNGRMGGYGNNGNGSGPNNNAFNNSRNNGPRPFGNSNNNYANNNGNNGFGGPNNANSGTAPIRDTRESRASEPLHAHLSGSANANSTPTNALNTPLPQQHYNSLQGIANGGNGANSSPNAANNSGTKGGGRGAGGSGSVIYCIAHTSEQVAESSVLDGVVMPSQRARDDLLKYAQAFSSVYLIVIYDRHPMVFGLAKVRAGGRAGVGQVPVEWVAPHRNVQPRDMPPGMVQALGVGELNAKGWFDGLRVAEGGDGKRPEGNLAACRDLHDYLMSCPANPDASPSTPTANPRHQQSGQRQNGPQQYGGNHGFHSNGFAASRQNGPRRTMQARPEAL